MAEATEVKAASKVPKLTVKNIIGYACGDLGGVITLTMVSGYLSRYMQVTLGVDAGILAVMLLIWNIWDAANDPLMGTIMDYFFSKAKPGSDKFRPWILASIPVIVIGLLCFFGIPYRMGGGWPMLIALFLLKIVYEGGYTMMNVAMGSMLGVMSTNDNERATLASARGMGSTIGGFIAGFVIPQILSAYNESADGYFIAGIFAAVAGGVIIFLHWALTVERSKFAETVKDETPEDKEKQKFKLSDILNIFKNNRAFLALVLHSLSLCTVMFLGTGSATYMYSDVLGDIGYQSYASTVTTIIQVVMLLAAPILTKKWDLVAVIRTCLVVSAAMYAGLLAYSLLAPEMNAWIFVIWNSVAYGFIIMSQQMQWGLVAEAIDYNEYISGKRNEGTIYGFFSLSRRIGSTIANSAMVLVIAAIGYNAEAAVQAAGTITGIKLMVIGFPMIAAILSFCCFTFIWNITDDIRKEISNFKLGKGTE